MIDLLNDDILNFGDFLNSWLNDNIGNIGIEKIKKDNYGNNLMYDSYTIKDLLVFIKIMRINSLGYINRDIARKLVYIYLRYTYFNKYSANLKSEEVRKELSEARSGLKEILDSYHLLDDIDIFDLIDMKIVDDKITNDNGVLKRKINKAVDEYGSFFPPYI